MKKGFKIFALLMAILLMAALLPGCGGNGNSGDGSDSGGGVTDGNNMVSNDDEESNYGLGDDDILTDEVADGEESDVQVSGVFFDTFKSGNYHMKFKIAGPEGGSAITEQYRKGDSMAMIMTQGTQSIKMIYIDEKAYMIDDVNKMVIVQNVTKDFYLDSGGVETTGMEYSGSGTAEFAGSTLPYEEYGKEDGSKIQYFLRGNTLAGIRTVRGGVTADMEVLALDTVVPADIFDLPADYQIITTD
ncbi:MAG: hypothetical protein FWG53_08570 [Clostridiales bacterium]|nr:hypothetical protein [Clostridiales bacterium]